MEGKLRGGGGNLDEPRELDICNTKYNLWITYQSKVWMPVIPANSLIASLSIQARGNILHRKVVVQGNHNIVYYPRLGNIDIQEWALGRASISMICKSNPGCQSQRCKRSIKKCAYIQNS